MTSTSRDNIEIQRMLRESEMMQTVELASSKAEVRAEIKREMARYLKTKQINHQPAAIASAIVAQPHTYLPTWSDINDESVYL